MSNQANKRLTRNHPEQKTRRCAWVCLVMKGDSYVPGAIVTAYALRLLKTRYKIICMVSNDVSEKARTQMRGTPENILFDEVVEVPYITHDTKPLQGKKQQEIYMGWIQDSYTKWNALTLVDYADSIILIDVDLQMIVNCDELFDLPAPAACYSNPWAKPYSSYGYNAYGLQELAHGSLIPHSKILNALKNNSFVGWGALVLLNTSMKDFHAYIKMLKSKPIYGLEYKSSSGCDEISIASFYALQKISWHHIHPRYLAIPWKENWVSRDIRAYHFHGRKPWEMNPDEWADLKIWWDCAALVIQKYPELKEVFFHTDKEIPQICIDLNYLRITRDIKNIVKKSCNGLNLNIDIAISEWIISLINTGPITRESKSIFRLTSIEDSNSFVDNLYDLKINSSIEEARNTVSDILELLSNRLKFKPMPSNLLPCCDSKSITYTSRFMAPVTPRISRMIELASCEEVISTVMQLLTIVDEAHLCLPQNHTNYLYLEHNVRNEAFASVLNSRLFEKKDTVYYSALPDKFGSSGNFLNANCIKESKGNWIMHPPKDPYLLTRMIEFINESLEDETPRDIFILLPSGEHSALLQESKYFVTELKIAKNNSFLVNLNEELVATDLNYSYIVLGNKDNKPEMDKAIRHLINS